jgi:hypothetical protein
MESVKYKNKDIPIIKLPKGTLLFRAVQHPESDFVGSDSKVGEVCIPMNYNVFFYTNPFVVDGIDWFEAKKGFQSVEVYKTTHELKVVSMIAPSEFTRNTRKEAGQFVESCSAQKACLKGKDYDPCFRRDFLEQHSDVHGWVAMAIADSKKVLAAMKEKKVPDDVPTVEMKNTVDGGVIKGIPEIALYPLKERKLEDVRIQHPVEWKSEHYDQYNYEQVQTLSRKSTDRAKFMTNHATLNPDVPYTYLYKDKEQPKTEVKYETLLKTYDAAFGLTKSVLAKRQQKDAPIYSGIQMSPNVKGGPWAMKSEAAERTLKYLLQHLHHSCYLLCVSNGEKTLYKLESGDTSAMLKSKLRKTTLSRSRKKWRLLQCIVKEYGETSGFSKEYATFIQNIKVSLPDGVFVLNLTDAVLLRKDETDPWQMVSSQPLKKEYKGTYLPILGGSGQQGYWDIPIPNYDDIRILLGEDKSASEVVPWNERKDSAVFRGTPTGCGYTTETNMRLKLATMRSDDLDVGVTTVKNQTWKIDPKNGLGQLDATKENIQPVGRLTFEEQGKHKYIIHIDGNVAAYRLLKMMTLGSVILKVKGQYTTWVDHVLQPKKHYVEVKEDLSDLKEVLEWCKSHDSECEEIGKEGRAFALQCLTKEYMESSFAGALWGSAV